MTVAQFTVLFLGVGWAASTLDLGVGRWLLRLLRGPRFEVEPAVPRRRGPMWLLPLVLSMWLGTAAVAIFAT